VDVLPSIASSDVVMMCGCSNPEIDDRTCRRCGLPNLVAILSFRPVVRVLDAATADEIRRCDLWGCEHHHHAKGRCRQHYDADRRGSAAH
jgi:hypothetical protein